MARVVWHVPVTTSAHGGATALRLFRLRDGRRCAVGFSSPEALAALLGPEQAHTELAEPALRALAMPLGVDTLVLDPRLVAAPVTAVAPAPTAQLQHR
ncbi:SAV_915 family protein [Streptomyces sp. NRRL WC-3742]|uniref:SAV_915 family protein n=1 Tax=Streptomyces sp. NRRL WC-3742 TaxID=1463934 RepID=UPI00068AB56B|nr:SAV_915 family protein [Streptomyces sp. NRRL WC-3742]